MTEMSELCYLRKPRVYDNISVPVTNQYAPSTSQSTIQLDPQQLESTYAVKQQQSVKGHHDKIEPEEEAEHVFSIPLDEPLDLSSITMGYDGSIYFHRENILHGVMLTSQASTSHHLISINPDFCLLCLTSEVI